MKDSLNSVVLYNFQIHTYNLIDFFFKSPISVLPLPHFSHPSAAAAAATAKSLQ